jgi:hypothetical protein
VRHIGADPSTLRSDWGERRTAQPTAPSFDSFFKAAKATFALKAGVWFRRARLFMVAPDSQAKHACRQAAIPLTALFKNPEPPLFTIILIVD